jgi:hypothetical protein
MSAPMVSGAIALILESHPELTQGQLRALLQAGARQPSGPIFEEQQVGPGELDLLGTLAALEAQDSPIQREPGTASRIALAASFIHPDPSLGLTGLLELRDDRDRVADGFDERRLSLAVSGGSLSGKPTRVAPGLYSFSAVAPEGSGGKELVLTLGFDGKSLAQRRVPIGTDRWAAEGTAYAHGGCAASPHAPAFTSWLAAFAWSALLLARRRRTTDAS